MSYRSYTPRHETPSRPVAERLTELLTPQQKEAARISEISEEDYAIEYFRLSQLRGIKED